MATLSTEMQASFAAGMWDSKAATEFRSDEAAVLLNYRVTPDGQAEVRGGSVRTHTTALNSGAQGYGGIEFTTAAGVKQWVVFVGDAMYMSEDEGETWSEEATGLRTDYWSLVTFNTGAATYLLCANGGASSYTWDGTTWATWSNIRSGTKFLAVHNERVWAYATGALVEASAIRDHETWASPDGLDLYVITHDGDTEVTGLYSIGAVLLVFKRKSIGYIDGYGNSDVIVAAGAKGISRDIGCIAFRSIVGVGTGVVFLSERGVEHYHLGAEPILISTAVSKFIESINWSAIEVTPGLPTALWYPKKLTYELALPGFLSQNDYTFACRVPIGADVGNGPMAGKSAVSLLRNTPATGDSVSVDSDGYLQLGGGFQVYTEDGYLAITTGADPGQGVLVTDDYLALATATASVAVLFTADRGSDTSAPIGIGYDGFVRQLDTGTLDDVLADGTGGVAIDDRLVPRPFIFGDPFRRKRGRFLQVLATASTGVTPTVALVMDGLAGNEHDMEIAASAGGMPREGTARVSGRGKSLGVEITNAGAGTKISAIGVSAEILKETPW